MKTSFFSGRRIEFIILTALFSLFVLFLYGPTITIGLLSFQGPNGGLTFPMNGWSLTWFRSLLEAQAVGDFAGAFKRSLCTGSDQHDHPIYSGKPRRRLDV
jgi:putative spermidine/putrescine transport system permease protein